MNTSLNKAAASAALVLALCAVFSCSAFADSYTETLEQRIEAKETLSIEMWHYSGGYWKVGNDSKTAVKVMDDKAGSAAEIAGYLEGKMELTAEFAYPREVLDALKAGKRVHFECSVPSETASLSRAVYGENSASVSFSPHFILASSGTFDDYVPGISVTIPLVDYSYGKNIYSVYGNGVSAALGTGRFSDSAPAKIYSPYIHPSMIKNKTGALKTGYTIYVNYSEAASSGYRIGNGTLSGGGAVGLEFYFPVTMTFSIYSVKLTEDAPEEPEKQPVPGSPQEGGGSSGDTGGGGGGSSGSEWRIHRVY